MFCHLINADTGAIIRPATDAEIVASVLAAAADGVGIIDGNCYVDTWLDGEPPEAARQLRVIAAARAASNQPGAAVTSAAATRLADGVANIWEG